MDNEFWEYMEMVIESSTIQIDRPQGSKHPRYPDLFYPHDYGYLKNTVTTDGGGLDVWLCSRSKARLDGIICTVDLNKKDVEIKLLIGCSEDELLTILKFYNSDAMRAIFIPMRDKE